jgi:hypothetical protein
MESEGGMAGTEGVAWVVWVQRGGVMWVQGWTDYLLALEVRIGDSNL